jgi:hypothetical protein
MRKGFNHKAPRVVKRAGFLDDIMAGSFTIRQFKNDFSAMLATQREQHDLQSAFLSAGTTKSSFVAAENHFSGFLAKDNE